MKGDRLLLLSPRTRLAHQCAAAIVSCARILLETTGKPIPSRALNAFDYYPYLQVMDGQRTQRSLQDCPQNTAALWSFCRRHSALPYLSWCYCEMSMEAPTIASSLRHLKGYYSLYAGLY
ncbi:hypothetical protein FA13DRAFT_1038204 [Coprinellus micaceus]|uniref:Uncharacterized protein n=1 Tax=Coprinellus micaceus TaxID=71717 RepID=A0A4Y7SX59_COPMI|nr:hypothetical protein FA13DRAFT_1038204 [Coprinellus micaceus]